MLSKMAQSCKQRFFSTIIYSIIELDLSLVIANRNFHSDTSLETFERQKIK